MQEQIKNAVFGHFIAIGMIKCHRKLLHFKAAFFMPRLWRAGTEEEGISIHGVCGESSCADRAFYKNPVYKGGRCRQRLRSMRAGCPWAIPVKINMREWLLHWAFYLQERIKLPCQFDCAGGNRGGNVRWSERTTMNKMLFVLTKSNLYSLK